MADEAKALSPEERDVMEHATAWRSGRHRNYFATTENTTDWPVWQGLVKRGLAKASAPVDWAGGMTYFSVTPDGLAALETQ